MVGFAREGRLQGAASPAARSAPAVVVADGFAECYAASFRGLVSQVYLYTSDLGMAHEVVQEAFCRALPRWSKLTTYEDPVAWVRRVAFNLANSRWRRAKVSFRYLSGQREKHVAGPSPDRVEHVYRGFP